jgi:hypothetical protein
MRKKEDEIRTSEGDSSHAASQSVGLAIVASGRHDGYSRGSKGRRSWGKQRLGRAECFSSDAWR